MNTPQFEITEDKDGYYWLYRDSNDNVIARSQDKYSNIKSVLKSIESLKESAQDAPIRKNLNSQHT